jgi:outer membrane lipoprotein-sorting protein
VLGHQGVNQRLRNIIDIRNITISSTVRAALFEFEILQDAELVYVTMQSGTDGCI